MHQLHIESCRCSTDPRLTEAEHKGDRVLECADCGQILIRDYGGRLLA